MILALQSTMFNLVSPWTANKESEYYRLVLATASYLSFLL